MLCITVKPQTKSHSYSGYMTVVSASIEISLWTLYRPHISTDSFDIWSEHRLWLGDDTPIYFGWHGKRIGWIKDNFMVEICLFQCMACSRARGQRLRYHTQTLGPTPMRSRATRLSSWIWTGRKYGALNTSSEWNYTDEKTEQALTWTRVNGV